MSKIKLKIRVPGSTSTSTRNSIPPASVDSATRAGTTPVVPPWSNTRAKASSATRAAPRRPLLSARPPGFGVVADYAATKVTLRPKRVDRTINKESIRQHGSKLSQPGQMSKLMPGKRRRAVAASSEGGPNSTSDQDDCEAMYRILVALDISPDFDFDRDVFAVVVNTSRINASMNTKQAADDLYRFLVEVKGVPASKINREPKYDESGCLLPGFYVLHSDDPGAKAPSVGLAGSVKWGDLKTSADTERTGLQLGSPIGMDEFKAHRLGVVGDLHYGTNDNYSRKARRDGNGTALKSDSDLLDQSQRDTLAAEFSAPGLSAKDLAAKVEAELPKYRTLFGFKKSHEHSLTGAERKEFFGADSGLPNAIVEKRAEDTNAQIKMNKGYAETFVDAAIAPDPTYQNRAFEAGKRFLGLEEDAFRSKLMKHRANAISADDKARIKAPDFAYATQIPALVDLTHEVAGEGSILLDWQDIDETLGRAAGFEFQTDDQTELRQQLLAFIQRDQVMGTSLTPDNAARFSKLADGFSTQVLAAAVALHMATIRYSIELMFEHITDPEIPVTRAAFNALIERNGGWDSVKVPDYDTVCAMATLFPGLDPANVMCAVDQIAGAGFASRSTAHEAKAAMTIESP